MLTKLQKIDVSVISITAWLMHDLAFSHHVAHNDRLESFTLALENSLCVYVPQIQISFYTISSKLSPPTSLYFFSLIPHKYLCIKVLDFGGKFHLCPFHIITFSLVMTYESYLAFTLSLYWRKMSIKFVLEPKILFTLMINLKNLSTILIAKKN